MKDLLKRSISGIVGVFFLIMIINLGGIYLLSSILVLTILGIREFYKALNSIDIKPVYTIGYIACFALFLNRLNMGMGIGVVLVSLTICLLFMLVFKMNLKIQDITSTMFGIVYIPFLLFYIYDLHDTPYIWLVFLMAFGTDTFAYFIGSNFGKNKLCPKISPKKSVEGSIGGILGSLLITISYSLFMSLDKIGLLIVLGVIVSIISQIGDLAASRIKREVGIKDYGSIMPGHGGVLDRFDSIIISAPIVYYYITYLVI